MACPCDCTAQEGLCSNQGHCNALTKQCECNVGYGGPFCLPSNQTSCAVLDRSGKCCDGVLTPTLECCSGVAALIDATGACCQDGSIDACGRCGGNGLFVDAAGQCCGTGGVKDASGLCCYGAVDACGICGGDGSTCNTQAQAVVNLPADAAAYSGSIQEWCEAPSTLLPSSLEWLSGLLLAIERDLSALAGRNMSLTLSSGLCSLARRLRALSEPEQQMLLNMAIQEYYPVQGAATLEFPVEGWLFNLTWLSAVPAPGMPARPCEAKPRLISTCPLPVNAVCGNAMCEIGERCLLDSMEGMCCPTDCPFPENGTPCVRGHCTAITQPQRHVPLLQNARWEGTTPLAVAVPLAFACMALRKAVFAPATRPMLVCFNCHE